MNFLKKIVFVPILGLVLTGCFGGGGVAVDAAVANERVALAMGQTMAEETTSLSMQLEADVNLTMTEYDMEDTRVYEDKIEGQASVDFKATDLLTETMEAALIASGSLKLTTFDGTQTSVEFDESVTANVYFSDMWLYVDATGIGALLEQETDDVRGKMNMEGLIDFSALPVPDSSMTSEEMTRVTDMLEAMLMEVEDVSAVETNGDLVVTYNITTADIVNVLTTAVTHMNTELTPSDIASFHEEATTELNELLTIREAQVIVGISKLGYMNRLDIRADLDLIEKFYDYSGTEEVQVGYNKVKVDATIEFDAEFNGNFTITLPNDLNTYPDRTPQPQ